jgi:FixJ family two-component response regulator
VSDDIAPVVVVVDDDSSVLDALRRLLTAEGYRVLVFSSSSELLARGPLAEPGCLLLDVYLPDVIGLELDHILRERGWNVPVIYMTGRADVPTSVRAMKAGAVDFLTKPIDAEDLLEAVGRALARDARARAERAELATFGARLATLTRREREVAALVAKGLLNKQSAALLGTSEKTIKVHRSRAMAKLGVSSVAELVRVADRLGLRPPDAR